MVSCQLGNKSREIAPGFRPPNILAKIFLTKMSVGILAGTRWSFCKGARYISVNGVVVSVLDE